MAQCGDFLSLQCQTQSYSHLLQRLSVLVLSGCFTRLCWHDSQNSCGVIIYWLFWAFHELAFTLWPLQVELHANPLTWSSCSQVCGKRGSDKSLNKLSLVKTEKEGLSWVIFVSQLKPLVCKYINFNGSNLKESFLFSFKLLHLWKKSTRKQKRGPTMGSIWELPLYTAQCQLQILPHFHLSWPHGWPGSREKQRGDAVGRCWQCSLTKI